MFVRDWVLDVSPGQRHVSDHLLGRSLSGGRAGAACPRVGKFAAAAATFWAEGRLLILGGSIRLAASRLIVSYW